MSDNRDPEVIEHDIENTREDLSRNLDALADRVSPGRVVGRQVDSVKGRFSGAKDAVMGTASSAKDASGSAVGSVGDTAGSAADKVSQQAQGNPLAAGLIAFGAGWLVSSLLPASQAETTLAAQAIEHGQPLIDHAKSVGQEVGDELKDKATQAASEVKDSAVESAQHVKDEGQAAADGVRNDVS